MFEHQLVGLAAIFVLGAAAQWAAWRLRLPSILLLLIVGYAAGAGGFGLIDVDELLGDLLFPVVSLSVAVILFEGGLSLRFHELRAVGGVVWRLVTIGLLVTWAVGTLAGHYLVGLSWDLALLLGAILVVSGPTVVQPLLRHIRPSARVGQVLKWEAIVIDPIGATLALLVFEAGMVSQGDSLTAGLALVIGKTLLVGGLIGLAGAGLLTLLLWRYWVPEWLDNAVALMTIIGVYTVADHIQSESGLLAVTVMGMAMANQKLASISHIVEFKENLRVLLISTLFILLAARLDRSVLGEAGLGVLGMLALMLFVARPAAVALAALGSKLSRNEKSFLAWMAPRGIVAAAVSSVFALRLEALPEPHPEAHRLVSLTFLLIVGTVFVYGLTAAPLAYRLNVAKPQPQGAMIIGAHRLGRAVAAMLMKEEYPVLLVDNDYDDVRTARMEGLPASYLNVLSDYALHELELGGIGKLLSMTRNDELNSLAILHLAEVFGRSELYQLPASGAEPSKRAGTSSDLKGRTLFGSKITFANLMARMDEGSIVKAVTLSKEFDFEAMTEQYGESMVPLFVETEEGRLKVMTADSPPEPKPGQRVIALVKPIAKDRPEATDATQKA